MRFAMPICIVLLLSVGLVFGRGFSAVSFYINIFIIKVRNTEDIPKILRLEPELKLKKKIIPRLYEFYKDPEDCVTNNSTYLSYLQQRLKDRVEYVEQAKSYFKPIDSNGQLKTASQANGNTHKHNQTKRYFKSLQAPYYGMGIPEAWEKGNKGKGVVIGMTDVGVVTDIPDFRDKIDFVLSKSFVIDNWGLEPTDFPFYPEDVFREQHFGTNVPWVTIYQVHSNDSDPLINKAYRGTQIIPICLKPWPPGGAARFPYYALATRSSIEYRDPPVHSYYHGNNCAGLIIGILNNSECTVGVAYEAKLAVLKIFSFVMGRMVINEAHIAEALVHELDRIHIFSNSWSTEVDQHFHIVPRFLTDVFEHSTLKGRHGKGRIHVFPPGGLACGFANSPYTITVTAVGTGGRNTEFSPECACVLTAAYGEGHTNSSNEFITTSSNQGNCTDIFKGTSPATAIIAGVIALVLQENDQLTWREVQYLIIESSSMVGIQDTKGFVKNAAGRFYHGSYGYGLINAKTLVLEAKRIQKFPKQVVYTSQDHDFIAQGNTANEATWKLDIACPCDSEGNNCMASVEQVLVKTSFTTHFEKETELIIISPSHTKSYLMRSGQSIDTATKRENAELLSVHFWGERAVGNWSLQLRKTKNTEGTVSIQRFVITLYGTIGEITDVHNTYTPGVVPGNIDVHCKHKRSTVNMLDARHSLLFIMFKIQSLLTVILFFVVLVVIFRNRRRYFG